MKVKLLIGIDDTDNLESKGTGAIADELIELIEAQQWGQCGFVTRHQLYIHPDIAYTSHNSSMIFTAIIEEKYLPQLQQVLADYLEKESAVGSDPGLCIAQIDTIPDKKSLIEFGYRAKGEVLNKEQAYALAALEGIFLVERGGEGIGVIGALAGVALRLDGNDGEVKGGLGKYHEGQLVPVSELLTIKKVSQVLCLDGFVPVPPQDAVRVNWKLKPVLYKGLPVLLVVQDQVAGQWVSLAKEEMRGFGAERSSIEPCEFFSPDVVEEEVYAKKNSCFNCMFRRWTADSFTCQYK